MQVEGQFNLIARRVKIWNTEGMPNAFNLLGANSESGKPYEVRISQEVNILEKLCAQIAKDRFPFPDDDWEGVLFAIVETLLSRKECFQKGSREMREDVRQLVDPVTHLWAALQWLLDDMHDAGEAYSPEGALYDSVENAGRVLKEYGGSPPFPLPEKKEGEE